MISPPGNTSWSLFFVPVFEWEPVEPASDSATPPTSGACDGGESASQQPTHTDASPTMRLVLKGYEWRAGWEYVLFPSAPWANCFDGGSYDAREDSARQEGERQARAVDATRQHKAQLRPNHPNPTIEPTATPTGAIDEPGSE